MISDLPGEAGRVLRYGMVGLLSLALHTAAALALALTLRWPAPAASAGGWFAGLALSFLGHHYFTFRSPRAPSETAPRFFILAAASLALNTSLAWAGASLLGLAAPLAAASAAIIAAGMNYMVARCLFALDRPSAVDGLT